MTGWVELNLTACQGKYFLVNKQCLRVKASYQWQLQHSPLVNGDLETGEAAQGLPTSSVKGLQWYH